MESFPGCLEQLTNKEQKKKRKNKPKQTVLRRICTVSKKTTGK